MARYFFDIDDGKRRVHDRTGMDLPSEISVLKEAGHLLLALAELRHVEDRPGVTVVRVRDSEGEQVYEGSTCLER